jgi:hypothetical protein
MVATLFSGIELHGFRTVQDVLVYGSFPALPEIEPQSFSLYPANLLLRYPVYIIFIIILLLLFPILLFSQVFPGTFPLKPVVNPTTQASSF